MMVLYFISFLVMAHRATSFVMSPQPVHHDFSLSAKTTKKKKQATAATGLKGFGGSSPKSGVNTDKSKEARAFYDYLEQQGAGDTLKRTALGYFPLGDMQLRGVVAQRDLKKGDTIINIPYEAAINLGQEGEDPTLPALSLLRDYCETMSTADTSKRSYYEMLPPFRGDDCMGSTDFFSDAALEALQSPLIKDETLQRRARTQQRFDQQDSSPKWTDGSPLTVDHLQWAVWLITSRVLTVQGEGGRSFRLLIPFLDMCNHDRSSPHVLTGRAVPGGELKVVAGAPIQAGEQVNICYGGGVAGNDRFLQDYGFLDADGFEMVAQQLLGKRRMLEGVHAGKPMLQADREATLQLLESTSLEQDKDELKATGETDMRAAIEYRLGVKLALGDQAS